MPLRTKLQAALVNTLPTTRTAGNLYGFGGTNSGSSDFIEKTKEGANAWYSEAPLYNPNNPTSASGHFTQMVWKSTNTIGCAWSQGKCGGGIDYYLYCEYAPPGNVSAEYSENVS